VTAVITANTDFAETEVDARRVNLTRFPLFFPEKRDFFLQDAGIFEFGGIRLTPQPFFSRRIGISPTGEPIDIEWGAKITGRVDRLNFGLLDVQTARFGDIDSRNLAVGRANYQLFGESTVGAIFTHGAPTADADNALVGADFNYLDSQFGGRDRTLEGHLWAQHTDTTGDTSDALAWGGSLRYPNETVNWDLFFSHIDDNFDPQLGFVQRRGIREYGGSYRYRWTVNSRRIENIDLQGRYFLVTNLDDEVETERITLPIFQIESRDDDAVRLSVEHQREVLFRPFRIRPDITIPEGDYRNLRWSGRLTTSPGRPLAGTISATAGDFFSGNRTDVSLGVDWRPNPNILVGGDLGHTDINLDQGDFITRIMSARFEIAFSPDISWNTIVQYDNRDDLLGLNTRFKWIIEPGNELFFVVNRGVR